MAWLIESYLNEEMKTAKDFHKKKTQETIKKISDDVSAEARNDRLEAQSKKDRLSNNMKDMDNAISRADAKVAVDKREDLGLMTDDKAARTRAIDAVSRHNRKHNPNIGE